VVFFLATPDVYVAGVAKTFAENAMRWLRRLAIGEEGQDLIEYGLLAAFISVAVVTAVGNIGTSLNTAFQSFAEGTEDFAP
jgi:pilus assembly protein Flp/PilA